MCFLTIAPPSHTTSYNTRSWPSAAAAAVAAPPPVAAAAPPAAAAAAIRLLLPPPTGDDAGAGGDTETPCAAADATGSLWTPDPCPLLAPRPLPSPPLGKSLFLISDDDDDAEAPLVTFVLAILLLTPLPPPSSPLKARPLTPPFFISAIRDDGYIHDAVGSGRMMGF